MGLQIAAEQRLPFLFRAVEENFAARNLVGIHACVRIKLIVACKCVRIVMPPFA